MNGAEKVDQDRVHTLATLANALTDVAEAHPELADTVVYIAADDELIGTPVGNVVIAPAGGGPRLLLESHAAQAFREAEGHVL